MTRIKYDVVFIESYAKRISTDPGLVERFEKQLTIFKTDITNPKLKDHYLNWNMQGLCAFLITEDIRVIYRPETDYVVFLDVGSHAQVYK